VSVPYVRPKYVYLAGPYTNPDPNRNVKAALDDAKLLIEAGFVPFVPHLYHIFDLVHPMPYETWMTLDLAWIARCDVLVRRPGDSSGADREAVYATSLGKPVFYGVKAFLMHVLQGGA